MKRSKSIHYSLLIITIGIIAISLFWPSHSNDSENTSRSYEEIIRSGTLRATTEYNAIGYFVDDDTITGFHFELARAFAHAKGLTLELIPEMDLQKQIADIHQGRFDCITGSLLITGEQKDSVLSFTVPILRNRQLLVQRKSSENDSTYYINHLLQLGGKTVYIPKGSPAKYRIKHLSAEIADSITIREVEKYGSEQLLAMVAHGDIPYAICEASLAQAAHKQYPQLDINTAISFNQFYGWGVPTDSPALLDTLNVWLKNYMRTAAFKQLLRKYRLQ